MKRSVVLFMIILMFAVLFNNTANRHRHIMPCGITIEHAHPIKSATGDSFPGKEHRHTEREIFLFTFLTDSPVLVGTTLLLPDIFLQKGSDTGIPEPRVAVCNPSILLAPLRAPPC